MKLQVPEKLYCSHCKEWIYTEIEQTFVVKQDFFEDNHNLHRYYHYVCYREAYD